MATKKTTVKKKYSSKASSKKASTKNIKKTCFCAMPDVPERELSPNVNPSRAFAIRSLSTKWVNGTVLRYYFFDKTSDGTRLFQNGSTRFFSWRGTESSKNRVRNAFKKWKSLGIGLQFEEVRNRQDAEVRIGFMRDDGHWSYVGRDVLRAGENERTMNLDTGFDLDTAMHEIGHTLGLKHEHQNPSAGIVWDEEAVYEALSKPPNRWSRQRTFNNIISKVSPDSIQGSDWDPNSIMHYPFEPGLIKLPKPYDTQGVNPAPGLSPRDKSWVRIFYPPLAGSRPELKPFTSQKLTIMAGEQNDFVIRPSSSRNYEIQTFGESDTVMVLFEEDSNGKTTYLTGDDDSGEDYNSNFRYRLIKGRKYVLRIRLYYSNRSGETAVMMW